MLLIGVIWELRLKLRDLECSEADPKFRDSFATEARHSISIPVTLSKLKLDVIRHQFP
jgi:hypothetical protein